MKLPTVHGTIARRVLVNYRADPATVARLLPAPFRPKQQAGHAIVGICLIRLRGVRPAGLPAWIGVGSENAAHRFAVEWDEAGVVREGVYIPRRDTNSWFNTATGGRIFPGVHHHAKFDVRETPDTYAIALQSDDGETSVRIRAHRSARLPPTSLFASVARCTAFFQAGCAGYSPTRSGQSMQGLELRCQLGNVESLAVDEVHSSYFEDAARFPTGSIEFDSALVMRDLPHEWRGLPEIVAKSPLPDHQQA